MELISIAAGTIGAAFLEEGVKFLWAEAAKILDRYHKRREKKDAAEVTDPAPEKLELPAKRRIDFAVVERRQAELKAAIGDLALYASGATPMAVDDRELLAKADALQRLIVEAYGIDAPELRVTANVTAGTVEDEVIGNELTNVTSGDVYARVDAKRVKKGGKVVGNKIDNR